MLNHPTIRPSDHSTIRPSDPSDPSDRPTIRLSDRPTIRPGKACLEHLSAFHFVFESMHAPKLRMCSPSDRPTVRPSNRPAIRPSDHPTVRPSDHPTKMSLSGASLGISCCRALLCCSVVYKRLDSCCHIILSLVIYSCGA